VLLNNSCNGKAADVVQTDTG